MGDMNTHKNWVQSCKSRPWTILRSRRSGVRVLIVGNILLSSPEGAERLWGLPSQLFHRNAGSLWGVNRVVREFDHLPLYSRFHPISNLLYDISQNTT